MVCHCLFPLSMNQRAITIRLVVGPAAAVQETCGHGNQTCLHLELSGETPELVIRPIQNYYPVEYRSTYVLAGHMTIIPHHDGPAVREHNKQLVTRIGAGLTIPARLYYSPKISIGSLVINEYDWNMATTTHNRWAHDSELICLNALLCFFQLTILNISKQL